MRSILILSLLIFNSYAFSHIDLSKTFIIQSEKTGDSYEIRVTLPVNYKAVSKQFPVVYYGDDGLISGNKIQSIAPKLMQNQKIADVILVGIKHSGDYRMKRRRDFIQAHHKNKKTGEWYSNDLKYGQASRFYKFLEEELVPKVEMEYNALNSKRTFIGHSLGGLFAIYASLQTPNLFDNYIALSPSLWVNYQNIWSFDRLFFSKSKTLPAKIFISAGGLEIANLILYNVNDYSYHLGKRNYSKLELHKEIYNGATHMSYLDQGIKDGLQYVLGK